MDTSDLAQSLLSQLAVRGVAPDDDRTAHPGERMDAGAQDTPVVTMILEGVAARRQGGSTHFLGLAGAGECIGLDPDLSGEPETGLWLTAGRYVRMPLMRIEATLDAAILTDFRLQDLRRKTVALRAEIDRHIRLRLPQRLAALLLDIHAHSDDDFIALRQSDLAELLSVRRAGVSTASGELQAAGALRIRRGGVELIDPAALRAAATLTPP